MKFLRVGGFSVFIILVFVLRLYGAWCNVFSKEDVNSLILNNKDKLWIGVSSGILILDLKTYDIEILDTTNSFLQGNCIYCLYKDKFGNILKGKWEIFLKDKIVYKTYIDKSKNLWFATNSGVYFFDRKKM